MDVDVDVDPLPRQVWVSLPLEDSVIAPSSEPNIPGLVITQSHNKANNKLKVNKTTRNIIVDGGCICCSSFSSLPYVSLTDSTKWPTESNRIPNNADDELDLQTNHISWILTLPNPEKVHQQDASTQTVPEKHKNTNRNLTT
ncbi:hypothetical protein PLEOSDRAFT_1109160 [Pleurotus ostreatus PC15]|uniref:Uncharacterized protein n=1 Tax=Pleurotus ostreatus (strain PC15) TaxID=1137138 RepID=A0A067N6Q0_PLEO1|nr:hypothetical protein PLEOSDRAFT_1109160 [Pleurotus ostreatus PC15]